MNQFDLLESYGSPLYVYDYSVLTDKCTKIKGFIQTLKAELPDKKISANYSTKANSNPAILSVIRQFDLEVDAMSPFELEIAQKSAFPAEKILYVCNNISADEMKYVHNKGVLICLDSISQVETYGQLFPESNIIVRINPGISAACNFKELGNFGNDSKFGISEENLPKLLDVVKKYRLRIIGVHQHLGNLFLDDDIPTYIDGVIAGLKIIKKYFNDIEIVDLGGGFGVPYLPDEQPLSLGNLAQCLIPVLKEFVNDYPSVKEFKFEPGRYISCEAGSILGTVTAIKHEHSTWWIGTDIGMNQLIRPSMYNSYHEIELIYRSNSEHPKVTANFCGNICEGCDILGKDRVIGLPEVGDIIVVHNAGAYGFSMSSNYTGRPRPAEIMFYPRDNTTKCIRRRESINLMLLQLFGKFSKNGIFPII